VIGRSGDRVSKGSSHRVFVHPIYRSTDLPIIDCGIEMPDWVRRVSKGSPRMAFVHPISRSPDHPITRFSKR
jgi:hypothetical protein